VKILLLNQYYAPAEAATAQLLQDLAEYLVARGHSAAHGLEANAQLIESLVSRTE
jgi:hypothetical protein